MINIIFAALATWQYIRINSGALISRSQSYPSHNKDKQDIAARVANQLRTLCILSSCQIIVILS